MEKFERPELVLIDEVARVAKVPIATIRAWSYPHRAPEGKTHLVLGFHRHKLGRLDRFDLQRFYQWLTEPKAVHQRRIDEFLSGSSAGSVEGVRGPGRPRKEVSSHA